MSAPHDARVDYVLALADDALVAAQRMGEWIAASPQIEEDVALGNIALDLLGQARSLLTYAGSLQDPVRTEDDLAYFRDEAEFRNVHLVERAKGDFGVAMARLLILATYHCELYERLQASTDETLAAVAAKAVKEVDYHRDHATMWVLRLGDGTDESHARMQAGLDAEWAYVEELFDPAYVDPALVADGVAVDPSTLRPAFDDRVATVLGQATLTVPTTPAAPGGGRRGEHTERDGAAARRPAGPRPRAPGGDVVTTTATRTAWEIAASVLDPEVPVLTIEDLGILRTVDDRGPEDGGVTVTITPTYSGCPAMDSIRDDVLAAFQDAGRDDVRVEFVLAPAWTTDWMSEAGKRKLLEYGIVAAAAGGTRAACRSG